MCHGPTSLFYKTCHITIKVNVYDQGFISGGLCDDDGATEGKATKLVTTVQPFLLTFVSRHRILLRRLQDNFQPCLWQQNQVF